MADQGENRERLSGPDRPERSDRKALLALFALSREGFARKDPAKNEHAKEAHPYGYGLGLITRARLFLRRTNLRKVRIVFVIGFLGWMLLHTLFRALIPDFDRVPVELLIIPPLLMLGCLGLLTWQRREYTDLGYDGPTVRYGSASKWEGFLMMVFGFGTVIAAIVRVIQTLTAP